MTDIDRYLPDEVIAGFAPALQADARYILRAALPGILAAHERDVLLSAADRFLREAKRYPTLGPEHRWAEMSAQRLAAWGKAVRNV